MNMKTCRAASLALVAVAALAVWTGPSTRAGTETGEAKESEILSRPVELEIRERPLSEVLEKLQKEAGLKCVAPPEVLKDAGKVTLSGKKTVKDFLDEAVRKAGLAWEAAEDGVVTIKPALDEDGSYETLEIRKQDLRGFHSPEIEVEGVERIAIRFPDAWKVTRPYAGSWTLTRTPEEGEKQVRGGTLMVTVEVYENHEQAVRFLKEIPEEGFAKVSSLEIGGWPALQKRLDKAKQAPGGSPVPPGNDRWITTAIAAGNLLVRLEAVTDADAPDSFHDEVEAIGRGVTFPLKADAGAAVPEKPKAFGPFPAGSIDGDLRNLPDLPPRKPGDPVGGLPRKGVYDPPHGKPQPHDDPLWQRTDRPER